MPSCARPLKLALLLAGLLFVPANVQAGDFAAQIESAQLVYAGGDYTLQAQIDYRLSPMAKEALHKGVALHWNVLFELREPGWPWDSQALHRQLPYSLQFHALLNQYVVQSPHSRSEMFLSLSAALKFMASAHDTTPVPATLLAAGKTYTLAVKAQFNRELLPIPLRPVAYLDPRWFLSSPWQTWPIQK